MSTLDTIHFCFTMVFIAAVMVAAGQIARSIINNRYENNEQGSLSQRKEQGKKANPQSDYFDVLDGK